MASPNGQDPVLHFRTTPALRARLDAARPVVAKREDLRIESINGQLLISKLLNLALDQLGIPRTSDEPDAADLNDPRR
jgi:hypothetical protein